MKKLICMLLALAVVLSLCACGSENPAQPQEAQQTEKQSDTAQEKTQKKNSEETVKELYGYRYCFPCEAIVDGTNYGCLFDTDYCGEHTIFAYSGDDMTFSIWDSVTTDCEKRLFSSLLDAYLCKKPSEQTVDTSELMTNEQGEELLRVTGQFKTSDGDVDYIIYYHVSDENGIRFFVGVMNDNNADRVTEVVDYMAEHLEKV